MGRRDGHGRRGRRDRDGGRRSDGCLGGVDDVTPGEVAVVVENDWVGCDSVDVVPVEVERLVDCTELIAPEI